MNENLLFEHLLNELRNEYNELKDKDIDFVLRNQYYMNVTKRVMQPFMVKGEKSEDVIPFKKTCGVVNRTSHFTNVTEAYIPMLGIDAVLTVGDKDTIIWKLFKILKEYRRLTKVIAIKKGTADDSAIAKIAINSLFGLVTNNWFSHMGLPFKIVSDEMHRRVKDMLLTIKASGATILTVDYDTLLYVGEEVVIEGVHNQHHKSVILSEQGCYVCYNSMPVSKFMTTAKVSDTLKTRSNRIIGELLSELDEKL